MKSCRGREFEPHLGQSRFCKWNHATLPESLILHLLNILGGSYGRVVKALDSKSNGLCPRRFKSCWLRPMLRQLVLSVTAIWQTSWSWQHQDGRVVKALDLSSNGRMSAWVRTPLLVIRVVYYFLGLLFLDESVSKKSNAPSEDRTHDLKIMRLTRCLLRHRGICSWRFSAEAAGGTLYDFRYEELVLK